jgi:hypothetical protein
VHHLISIDKNTFNHPIIKTVAGFFKGQKRKQKVDISSFGVIFYQPVPVVGFKPLMLNYESSDLPLCYTGKAVGTSLKS